MDERDGEKQRRRACLERSPRGPRHSGGRSLFPESVGEYLAQRGFDPCVARAASRIGRSGVPKQHPEGTGVGDGAGGGRTHCWRPQRRRGFRPRHQPPARAARRPGASESTARGGVRTCAAPHAAARRQGTHWGRRWRRARAEDGLRVPDHWEALQQPGKGGGKAVHVRDLRQRARRRRHRCGPAGWKMGRMRLGASLRPGASGPVFSARPRKQAVCSSCRRPSNALPAVWPMRRQRATVLGLGLLLGCAAFAGGAHVRTAAHANVRILNARRGRSSSARGGTEDPVGEAMFATDPSPPARGPRRGTTPGLFSQARFAQADVAEKRFRAWQGGRGAPRRRGPGPDGQPPRPAASLAGSLAKKAKSAMGGSKKQSKGSGAGSSGGADSGAEAANGTLVVTAGSNAPGAPPCCQVRACVRAWMWGVGGKARTPRLAGQPESWTRRVTPTPHRSARLR